MAAAGSWEHLSGWDTLTENEQAYVESCFAGKTLQQVLEALTFTFTIDGVTRAFTHEFVRARIGSGFMQHGGRDNDWRHRDWTIPETIRRAAIAVGANPADLGDQQHCLVNTEILEGLAVEAEVDEDYPDPLMALLEGHLKQSKRIYAALVDAGIPWQDARRILPIGTQTYIHGQFNYLALKGVLANRLEHIMDWEINCVSQLMLREIKMKCPPLFSKYLGSHSDLQKRAAFERLESWPPDGKYPAMTMRCATCGHANANHVLPSPTPAGTTQLMPDERVCEVCARTPGATAPLHRFKPEDMLPRMHRAEQMPFFVLHPDSMAGGPVKWLWTNGNYQDINSQL